MKYFTSESVTVGHPDKVCDIVADTILDAHLALDPNSRVACEVIATTDYMCIFGEITSTAKVDITALARKTIADIGYTESNQGFDAETAVIDVKIHTQSPDIALGVDNCLESKNGQFSDFTLGAGDQGMMFGYACNETEELMPLPITLAHRLTNQLYLARKNNIIKYLKPDGKAQVTVQYDGDKPVRVDTIVVSTQHSNGIKHSTIVNDVKEIIIANAIDKNLIDKNTKFYINPTGSFVVGGPHGDSGLTGRKIIVDTYGGYCPHGGGSFSGKDPSKVDRSATYMARYVCKNIVARGLAKKCEMQVSYAIGVAKPVSVYINTFNTGTIPDEKIAEYVLNNFDLRPAAIVEKLGLKKPCFAKTARNGHFGKSDFAWEKTVL